MKKRAFEQGDEKTVEQMGRGKDIISILSEYRLVVAAPACAQCRQVRANEETDESERLSEEEVIAQLTYVENCASSSITHMALEPSSSRQWIQRLTRSPARCIRSDRKSTRLNSSHSGESRMPSSA